MNREEFNQYWMSKGHQPSSTDYKAYQLGQQMSENTVQGQQNKIAKQIRQSSVQPPAKAGSAGKGTSEGETVNHHPTQHYLSWGEYSGNKRSMGYAVERKDYDHYLRNMNITTQDDHDISRQNIHKNEQGAGSISKGEPDHVHDKNQGDSTSKGIPKVKPTPTPPESTPADTSPTPPQRTQTYTYPYKNLPFDPSRQPPEIGDDFYSTKYQTVLAKWGQDNWDRYQKKQPLLPKPLPPKETMLKERDFLTGKQKSYNDVFADTVKKVRFIPATDIKTSPYVNKKPYYLFIDGVKQPKIYDIKGNLYDESGPSIKDLGYLNQSEGYSGAVDTPEKIKAQAWSRGFDLLSAGTGWLSAAATTSKAASAVVLRQAAQRQMARNAARLRNLTQSGRYGNLSTRGIGISRSGLVNRGSASLGRTPSRIGELPVSGGVEALQNVGL